MNEGNCNEDWGSAQSGKAMDPDSSGFKLLCSKLILGLKNNLLMKRGLAIGCCRCALVRDLVHM